jgi:hypothetical protein
VAARLIAALAHVHLQHVDSAGHDRVRERFELRETLLLRRG